MARFRLRAFGFLIIAALLAQRRRQSRAETEVDLALVIAVDMSYSMDPDEQMLQREGFIQAFRSPDVHDSIRRGVLGRIAVAYMEWAGAGDQKVVLPWTVLDGSESATAFAERLAEAPTRRAQRTSISGAIDFGVRLLAESGFAAVRQVIDVSGDGPNNQGRPVAVARDEALASGITINGLPIMLKAPGYFDIPDLDNLLPRLRHRRPGRLHGAGARARAVPRGGQDQDHSRGRGAAPPEPLIRPAQALSRRANCLAGEMQWRDRMGN